MWAQRFEEAVTQEAIAFSAATADDLASQIGSHVAKYFVRVVSMSAYAGNFHHAIVIFERESV
jgi:uncharacterized membrane protein